jgi:hypothetical protein
MRSLVLNRAYIPIKVVNSFSAVIKLYTGKANVIISEETGYKEFNWNEWAHYSMTKEFPTETEFYRSQHYFIASPKVIRLLNYSRIPKATVQLNRKAIYDRDERRCYICGKQFHDNELTLDHIIPVSKGGIRSWNNLITCCKPCNAKKGDKLLAELKIKPKFLPHVPHISNMQRLKMTVVESYPEWKYWGI